MKKITISCLIILCLLCTLAVTDFSRVSGFEKPVFCLPKTADDGGSGIYYGLFYRFEIRGNFLPEDEFPGVTHYRAYLFGKEIAAGIRD